MSNPVEPEKPGLAAQADSVFRDHPAVAAVLRDVANDLAELRARVLVLEKKLDALAASRVPPAA